MLPARVYWSSGLDERADSAENNPPVPQLPESSKLTIHNYYDISTKYLMKTYMQYY